MNLDVNIYLAVSDYGAKLGICINEAGSESWDREQVISDLLHGHLEHCVKVLAMNPFEGWSRDVTDDIKAEVWQRYLADGFHAGEMVPAFCDDDDAREYVRDARSYDPAREHGTLNRIGQGV